MGRVTLASSCARGLRWVLIAVAVLPGMRMEAAADEAVSAVRPLQTELIGPLDLSRVHVESSVLVRVALTWSAPGCTLEAGAIVQGRVTGFVKRSKTVKNSQVEVAFDAADCNGKAGTARSFTLVALVGPAGSTFQGNQSGVSEAPPLADAVGLAVSGGIRSAATASAINANSITAARSLPSRIVPGQVVDIAHVNLSVGTGTEGATVMTATGRDLRLERGTSLILVPKRTPEVVGAGAAPVSKTTGVTERAAAGALTSGGSVVAAVDAPEPVDETEICSGVCNTVAAAEAGKSELVSASMGILPIQRLGFAPRDKRQAASFDDETTLTYLDEKTLLCTFDPHQLRQRTAGNDEAARTIRAVLIDAGTHTVKRIVEWKVRGDDQYLWRVAGGRVLVHMGHELRLFDAELKPVRSIPLEGRVAWVVSSPSGDHIAVGTVRERYSAYVYRELQAVLAEDPEEDIQVRVFNSSFDLLLSATRSSKAPMPVFSDAGELRVHAAGRDRWRIAEYGWDRSEHTVATAKSACRPLLSTPEHGLIFAVGCTATGGRWYRMLRQDGHPLLKGTSPSDEIEQTARGSAEGDFAVRIVRTAKPMNYGQPFTRTDLTKEEIAVYRGTDGASVEVVSSEDFALSEQAFALSPAGDQMALAGSRSILFYEVRR